MDGNYFSPLIEFNSTLVMHWITLLILFFILKKYFFEKVRAFLDARQYAVKHEYENAESLNRAAQARLDEYNKQLAEFESEGREIIHRAKNRADDQAKVIIDEAQQKAEALMARTQTEIEREKQKAVAEMKNQIAMLALMAAGKIIEKDLAAEGHDTLIDQIIEQAGTSTWQN